MIGITLYWKRDGEDVQLGTGFCEVVPPKGTLVSFPCGFGVGWRVTEHHYLLVMEGSATWRAWRAGESHEGSGIQVFVEPADGPFEPWR